MKLHVLPPSPRAIKVLALTNHLGLDCEIRALDYAKAEQTTAAFTKLNPNARQPVLEDDGWVLWESNAILHYLASKAPERGLWPAGARDQADVLRWLMWEAGHWDPACDILITERLKKAFLVTEQSGRRTRGRAPAPAKPDPARLAEGQSTFHELAAILNTHLRGRRWMTGERLTIADFALGAWLPAAEPAGYPFRAYEEIARWYGSLESLRGWTDALPRPS